MFAKRKARKLAQENFNQGFQDGMKLTCQEYFGAVYMSWMRSPIEKQAFLIVQKQGGRKESITLTFSNWTNPSYQDGVNAYFAKLAEAIEQERANRTSVKVRL